MFTESLWNSLASNIQFPALEKDIVVDVAIIGGGITGVTTAQLLKQEGYKVVVLEARKVGRGTTGHSTGNLYTITDELLSPIQSKHDIKTLKRILQSRREAFELIERNISEFAIDCDYKKQSMFVYEDGEHPDKIEKEQEIAVEAGFPFSEITGAGFPFQLNKGFRIPDQAQFNPLLYIEGLAAVVQDDNCEIYEGTKVSEIEEQDENLLLHTSRGKVTAKNIVHATHTPKGIEVEYHTTLGPYREYGVAAKLENSDYPEGIFWGYYNNQKYSLRSYNRDGENYLICVGKPHKVGQAENNQEHIEGLINFLKERFQVKEITNKWGGQHYRPADLLPYIGRKSRDSRQFVATGFSTDGLIYGSLSAMIIADLIAGRKNAYADLFEATRKNPLKSAEKFTKENINVAAQYLKDLPFKAEDTEIENIKPGVAKIVQKDDKKAAVYRDEQGELYIFSALCTHMGCVVHWNNAEKTWDCPCHGSRFDKLGEVIEGPAFDGLNKVNNK